MKFSYLNLETTDAAWNLAVEEYVFDQLPRDRSYLMLWQNANAVVIGKHQNAENEVNLAYARQNEIQVVRRLSGGGAVYHDMGNLNYTIISDAEQGDSLDFGLYCQPVLNTLKKLGIQAELSGRNDMTIQGRKFSGNAEYVRDGRIMHHGTLMFHSDLSVMEEVLQVDPEKVRGKGVKSVRSRVTNISEYLNTGLTLPEFREKLLEEVLCGNEGEEYQFYQADQRQIERICDGRYRTEAWNFGELSKADLVKKKYIPGCGCLQADVWFQAGRIKNIRFSGDFFSILPRKELEEAMADCKWERTQLAERLESVMVQNYIAGLDNQKMIQFFME